MSSTTRRRESDPPADASGGGGRPASHSGGERRRRGTSAVYRNQEPNSQGINSEQGHGPGADPKTMGSSATQRALAVKASHGTGSGVRASSTAHRRSSSRNKETMGRARAGPASGGGSSPGAVRASHGSIRNGNNFVDFDYDDDTTSLDSTPRRTDWEMGSGSSSLSASPFNSADGAGDGHRSGAGGGGDSSTTSSARSRGSDGQRPSNGSGASSSGWSGGTAGQSPTTITPNASRPGGGSSDSSARSIPSVSAGPGGVPFGASALKKNAPNDGRPRPRGLRPRSSFSSGGGGGGFVHRTSSSSGLSSSFSSASGRSNGLRNRGAQSRSNDASRMGASESPRAAERGAAGIAAPGVAFDVVVQAAVKIESIMRVLIARGYVRRKLVSEVTAFSLIMERGIEVIKHPFSGKAKPKSVTVNFVSRKEQMQLSWGGKSGVPLETIHGVTKGIKTDALRRVVDADRAENCFSLLTPERTIDFEVDNPWLVLLVVRALRLFLGAHYDTLPAPTFFSHLCLRPRGADRSQTPRQALVWTEAEKTPVREPASTPTERTLGDSASDDSEDGDTVGHSSDGGDVANGSAMNGHANTNGGGDNAFDDLPPPPPPVEAPTMQAPMAPGAEASEDTNADNCGDIYAEEEGRSERSPGGIMALFSSGRRLASIEDMGSSNGVAVSSATTDASTRRREQGGDEPLTASQLLATRGMGKRLTLSKKLSAANSMGGPLKGKRFELMALPMDRTGQQEREERGFMENPEIMPKRTQGMSISIGAGYELPEEQERSSQEGSKNDPERIAVVDDLNVKLQSLRKLCVPQQRIGAYRPGRAPKTMALKHMAFFQGAGGSSVSGSGMGSIADMWGDGVRRQYQTDMVRQKNESVDDVRKRDDARTAMLVTRSGVHRVTRKGVPSDLL